MKLARILGTLLVALAACGEEELRESDNQPPVARMIEVIDGRVGEVVTFDGSASGDPDGQLVSYTWDFGDGSLGEGRSASHIYNQQGSFTVVLTVADNLKATARRQATARITDNASPVAVIDALATARVGVNVRFTGSRSSDADGTISRFDWDFGDGGAGAGSVVDHVFSAAGTFLATLTVIDDKGGEHTAEHEIVITAAPLSYAGRWSWALVDPSKRDLGMECGGAFQDSMLDIVVNAPSITVTEDGGGTTVAYRGSIAGADWVVQNNQYGIIQTIDATFTSPTTFTGVYKFDPSVLGWGPCEDRAVTGAKTN